jgi:threonine/homoserine/homoserine lactone efflux protein
LSIESAISFFIAIFIFAITPGPGVFVILATALKYGVKSCFSLALGMTISDIIYLIAAIFGLSIIANSWSEFFTIMRVIGGFYLLYLAYKIWHNPLENTRQNLKSQSMMFVQGFLISLSNPKVIIFYIAFLPTFFDMTNLLDNIILVSSITLIALMLGLMLIAIFADKAKKIITNKRGVKILNALVAIIMASAAIYLFAISF